MKKLGSNPLIWGSIVAVALFLLTWVVVGDVITKIALSAIGLITAIVFLIRWRGVTGAAISAGARKREHQWVIANSLLIWGLVLLAGNSLLKNLLQKPLWWPDIAGTSVLFVLVAGLVGYVFATRWSYSLPLRVWLIISASVVVLSVLVAVLGNLI